MTITAVTRRAAVPLGVHALLTGPPRRARLLGAFPTAAYLALDPLDAAPGTARDVLAVLTVDAVRLPIGLVLPTSSAEFPLDRVAGAAVVGLVGGGAVRIGALTVHGGRTVSAAVPRLRQPDARLVGAAAHALGDAPECTAEELAALRDPHRAGAAARRLLGRGSGLTPAGDDVLAGYLVAAAAYDLPSAALRAVAVGESAGCTTDLSAALLRRAALGETIPELAALLVAMSDGDDVGTAVARLARVGHTSGAALAAGAITAARGPVAQ